jgi:hypothetical protein
MVKKTKSLFVEVLIAPNRRSYVFHIPTLTDLATMPVAVSTLYVRSQPLCALFPDQVEARPAPGSPRRGVARLRLQFDEQLQLPSEEPGRESEDCQMSQVSLKKNISRVSSQLIHRRALHDGRKQYAIMLTIVLTVASVQLALHVQLLSLAIVHPVFSCLSGSEAVSS